MGRLPTVVVAGLRYLTSATLVRLNENRRWWLDEEAAEFDVRPAAVGDASAGGRIVIAHRGERVAEYMLENTGSRSITGAPTSSNRIWS